MTFLILRMAILKSADQKSARVISGSQGTVIRASEVPSVFDSMETANLKAPIQTRPFSAKELSFWSQYGINQSVLDRHQVIAISRFTGVGKEGKEYELFSSDTEPMFGYRGRKHTKIYRPCSNFRFLYAGEKTENYVFGFEQLPLRGDIIFITGGEKDVFSLVAHGFNAISLNSETANIPKNLLRGLGFRFRHITILYDVDETGLASMDKIVREYKEFDIKSLRLPLTGEKSDKDISDFFRDNHTAEDLMMLFREMLDQEYEETITLMRTCEIDFNRPPEAPEPLLSINEVTIGTAGNLVCVAGSEGSGKTNYLGGIISGAIRPYGIEIDTLGTTVRENISDHAVLLFDTEQSEYQLYKNLTYIVRRASLEKPPVWFKVGHEVARAPGFGSTAKGIGYHTHREGGEYQCQHGEGTESARWLAPRCATDAVRVEQIGGDARLSRGNEPGGIENSKNQRAERCREGCFQRKDLHQQQRTETGSHGRV